MTRELPMPQLTPTMEEAEIVAWRVAEGASFKVGDILAEVQVDKAVMEMAAPQAGIIQKLIARPGVSIPVGKPIALLADAGDGTASVAPAVVAPAPAAPVVARAAPAPAPVPAAAPPSVRTSGPAPVSPRARRIAATRGIDPTQVAGTGPHGRVLERDLPAAAAAASPVVPTAGAKLVPHTMLRRKTAERMVLSCSSIPSFDLTVEVRVDALIRARATANAGGGRRIAIHDYIIEAVAQSLLGFELLTGRYLPDGVEIPPSFGIGLAIAVDGGLVAPVLRDAASRSLVGLAAASADLVSRARAGRLSADDYAGGAVTISNLGMLGIDNFRPIIVPGQAAILGVGRMREILAVEDGRFFPAKAMSLTLAADHRLVDGEYAARFLGAVKTRLETVH
jgi:pyruvate dehydrogenase E2 component (dihydrolipoamide acetyltransferase)